MPEKLMRILSGASETHTSPSYRWNNASRRNAHVIFQYTEKGACCFREGNNVTRVTEDRAFLATPPEDTEYWYPEDAPEPYVLEWISFSGKAAISLAHLIRQQYGSVVSIPKKSEALLLFRRILQLFQTASFRDRFQECELIHSLMMAILREQAYQEEQRDPVVFCYNYLHDHHRSGFNIKNLAADLGISREHLTREFTKRYGQTPAALLRELRLQTAQNQLLASQQSLEHIARASGLTCARNLSRLFTQAFGLSPDQFRRQHVS